jgi:hypothetical protein
VAEQDRQHADRELLAEREDEEIRRHRRERPLRERGEEDEEQGEREMEAVEEEPGEEGAEAGAAALHAITPAPRSTVSNAFATRIAPFRFGWISSLH